MQLLRENKPMAYDPDIVRSRLREALERSAYTQEGLANAIGLSKQSVGKWFRTGQVSLENIANAAGKLGVSVDWLLGGEGYASKVPSNGKLARDKEGSYNVSEGPPIQGRVPEISWVQAGEPEEAIDLYHPGDGESWVPTTVQVRHHTYALRVENDSMMPRFPPGYRIVVEPEMDAENGDFVIAKDPEGNATFKQLVKEGGDWYLKPLNPQYPVKPLDGWVVIGVVREAVERFK